MSQDTINLILAILGILSTSGVLLYVIQQFYLRNKNKVDYGSDLLKVVNETTASLKQTRADLTALEQELRLTEKEGAFEREEQEKKHKEDRDRLEQDSKERIDRLKARVKELEGVLVKYDISFTLTTNPTVQVTDLRVIGKDDVMASQRMKAITAAKKKE